MSSILLILALVVWVWSCSKEAVDLDPWHKDIEVTDLKVYFGDRYCVLRMTEAQINFMLKHSKPGARILHVMGSV